MIGRDRLRVLWPDDGMAAVEFALLTPVLLVTLLGIADLGYNLYTQSLLEGAIQGAARASTIEDADDNQAAIDARVTKAVQDIAPSATLTFERTAYTSFSSVNKPEDYTDTNKNGTCDKGEPYEDVNGNATWDQNQGKSGMGGSRDIVVYLVTVSYPRPFPAASLLGMSSTFTMNSRTVLANQPWDNLEKVPPVKNCK